MQLLRDVKSCFELFRLRTRYAGVAVGFGSRISGGTTIGPGTRIEADCRLHRCALGKEDRIGQGSWLSDATLADHVAVHPGSRLGAVDIGSYSYVGDHSDLRSVRVGRFTSVGPFCICGFGAHPTRWISTSPVFYSTRRQCGTTFADSDLFLETPRTLIGHDVWVGARAFLRDGIRIGNGAIVGAGAVVVADVPDYAVVGGVPARVIRFRFAPETVRRLLEASWWEWPEETLRRNWRLFSTDDVEGFLRAAAMVTPSAPSRVPATSG